MLKWGAFSGVILLFTTLVHAASAPPASPTPSMVGPMPQPMSAKIKMDVVPSAETHPIYDTTNPDYKTLQKSPEVLARYPVDKKGKTDWMAVIRSGDIQPRANLDGTAKLQFRDDVILMKNTKNMPYVKFPHNSHTLWLGCVNCHDEIFIPKIGANKPSMSAMVAGGQTCGVCHGKVSFPLLQCERCHSAPQEGQKAWW